MRIEAKQLEELVRQMQSIEKDVLTGVTDEMCNADPEYSHRLAELKRVTDELRTSMWCAYVAKNSPDKVKQFVERHRMNRIVTLLRNRYPLPSTYPMAPTTNEGSKEIAAAN